MPGSVARRRSMDGQTSRPRAGSPFRGQAAADPPPAAPHGGARPMTETLSRGAANQAGAHINKNAYAEAKDFLPLKGIDHVEFWVGNARQAAHYFRAAVGLHAGRLFGPRDRRPRSDELRHAPERHHDRPHRRPVARRRDRRARPSPRRRRPRHRLRRRRRPLGLARDDVPRRPLVPRVRGGRLGEDGVLRRSAIHTYGEVIHSFIDRSDYHGAFAPGFRKIKKPARPRPACPSSRSTTASATSSSAT